MDFYYLEVHGSLVSFGGAILLIKPSNIEILFLFIVLLFSIHKNATKM